LQKLNLQEEIKRVKRPFLVSGPCSAESEEQVFTTVQQLAENTSVNLLRFGIWKPRTRPNSFEGLGEIALPWAVEAGKKVKLPISVEVANKQHVESALKAGVDVLWIGARTTVNPFAIQEIADTLKGVNIPVMIKNPINPDLELWIGAFERLENAGITDLTAIHRGFSYYKHTKYRNLPNWEIPIHLKERLPHIPIICDPSHITGKSELLLEVAQKAMDLNFDGLMIESHCNPSQAWSDARQQITPFQLAELLAELNTRNSTINADFEGKFIEMREKISVLDDRLFDILATRMRLSDEIGDFKREHNITILQQKHWNKIIDKRLAQTDEYQLTPKFIRRFMDEIHQESIRHQLKVMNPKIDTEFSNED
jgi:chorismate mutase